MKLISRSNYKYIAILAVLVICEVAATSLLPHWNGLVFGEIANKSNLIYQSLFFMICNSLTLEFSQIFKSYTIVKAQVALRREYTQKHIHLVDKLDTAPQRIQEDIKGYIQNSLQAYTEIVISVLITFFLVLLNVSNGWLLFAAFMYTVVILGLTKLFNPWMRKAERNVQEKETRFRDDLRINKSLDKLEDNLYTNLWANRIRVYFTLFSRCGNQIMMFLPYFLLLPLYLKGYLQFGEFMANVKTFVLIALNSTIVVTVYATLTTGQACGDRIRALKAQEK